MNYDIKTANRYRQHAATLRSLAADYQAETAEIILGVANDYESMARTREGGAYPSWLAVKT